jgi:hypothetical protein
MMTQARNTSTNELEAALSTPPYLVGPYLPPLKQSGFLPFSDWSKDEWEVAENLVLALNGQPAQRLQDEMAALALVGDAETLASAQTLAVASDKAATDLGRRMVCRTYRAYAEAWRAWQELTVAALRDGRLRSPALEQRAELLRAIAHRLGRLPSVSAQWEDAQLRELRAQLSAFDVARGMGFLAQF